MGGTTRTIECVQASYLNDSETRAIGDDLAVFDLHVEFFDFRHAQIAQGFGRDFDGACGGVFPRLCAGADDFRDAIDACLRGFLGHVRLLIPERSGL
jgi:hypothetical protein